MLQRNASASELPAGVGWQLQAVGALADGLLDRSGRGPSILRPQPLSLPPIGAVTRSAPFSDPPAQWTDTYTVTAMIPAVADVMGELTLCIDVPAVPGALPDASWRENVGYIVVRRARLVYSTQILSEIDSLFYYTHARTLSIGSGFNALLASDKLQRLNKGFRIYMPLLCPTSYRRNGGLPADARHNYLPLHVLTQYGGGGTHLRVEVDIESFEGCLPLGQSAALYPPPPPPTVELLVRGVSVAAPERLLWVSGSERPCTYLTPVICTGYSYFEDSSGGLSPSRTIKVSLANVNGPVSHFLVTLNSAANPLGVTGQDAGNVGPPLDSYTEKYVSSAYIQVGGVPWSDNAVIPDIYRLWTAFRGGPNVKTYKEADTLIITHALYPGADIPTGYVDYSNIRNASIVVTLFSESPDSVLIGTPSAAPPGSPRGLIVTVYAMMWNSIREHGGRLRKSYVY